MRGTLYDRYQLANSTAIPLFNGSNGQEAIRVSQYMQGLYDQNLGTALQTQSGVDNMQGHPADVDVVNQTKDYYKGKLKELSRSGDWENMLPQTQQLASAYARDASAISSIQLQKQEWAKQLDDKEKNLTSSQKQRLQAIAEAEYADPNNPNRLRRDGNGQLRGSYGGTRVDKNIDVAEKIDKWMKSAAEQAGGRITQGTDGTWMHKVGTKWERMSSATIQKIIHSAAANDQEFQGYRDMMGRIESHGIDRVKSPDQLKDGPYKQQALKLAKAQGISFGQALKKVVYDSTANGVLNNALSYGTTKYAKNNAWTEQGLDADAYGLKAAKEGPDDTPTMIQGPNTKTTNDEQDLGTLQENVGKLTTNASDVDGQIKRFEKALQSTSLKPEERTQLESNLNNARMQRTGLQSQLDRAGTIMNYSKMKTAQDMGYNNYDNFVETQKGLVAPEIKKIFPNGLKSNSGKTLSPEDLAKAYMNGQVKAVKMPIATGAFLGPANNTTIKHYEVTRPDGTKTLITSGDAAKISHVFNRLDRGSIGRYGEFNKLNEQNHTKNVKDYSIQDNVVTLDDAKTKDFTNALRGAYDGIKFKKIGEFGELKDSDRPANFRVNAIGMPGPSGEARLMIEELDEKNIPTGNRYEANATNSNINQKMARFWGKQPTVEARQAAAMMDFQSPSTILKGQPLGTRLEIGDAMLEGKPVKAHITISGTDSKPEYNLTDGDGNIIKSTKELGTAGNWIKAIKNGK